MRTYVLLQPGLDLSIVRDMFPGGSEPEEHTQFRTNLTEMLGYQTGLDDAIFACVSDDGIAQYDGYAPYRLFILAAAGSEPSERLGIAAFHAARLCEHDMTSYSGLAYSSYPLEFPVICTFAHETDVPNEPGMRYPGEPDSDDLFGRLLRALGSASRALGDSEPEEPGSDDDSDMPSEFADYMRRRGDK